MGKPVMKVASRTANGLSVELEAVFDSGSHHTLVRESALPAGCPVIRYDAERVWGTAAEGAALRVIGVTELEVSIGERKVEVTARVSPNLTQELVIGAGAMQMWDISIENRNGQTRIHVGRDMRDRDVTLVL